MCTDAGGACTRLFLMSPRAHPHASVMSPLAVIHSLRALRVHLTVGKKLRQLRLSV